LVFLHNLFEVVSGEVFIWNQRERHEGEPGMTHKWCWSCL